MDPAEGKHCKCNILECTDHISPLSNSPIHPPFYPQPPSPPKLLVCEIWKRHVVFQFVQYTSQVGSRYTAPQWLKNDCWSARWLWWTSLLPALSFFSIWLPRQPRGQRSGNLSYLKWSCAPIPADSEPTNEQALRVHLPAPHAAKAGHDGTSFVLLAAGVWCVPQGYVIGPACFQSIRFILIISYLNQLIWSSCLN